LATDVDWSLDRIEGLCAVDSTSGAENRILPALRALLREMDADVLEQPVDAYGSNVLARWGEPRVLLTTHLDTVPPFLPPRRVGARLYGRGTCDAKGQVVAQLAAIARLLRAGVTDVAWLGVVGEEVDSRGAIAALALKPALPRLAAVIDGEPTGNRLGAGQRGFVGLRLTTSGVPAHSGMPELGRSALWPMLEWLDAIRRLPMRADADLGDEVANVGVVRSGDAHNVVPAWAEARILARPVPGSTFVDDVRKLAPAGGEVEVTVGEGPHRFPAVPGFETAPLPFGSDLPRLMQLAPGGQGALVGPGSIAVAHTEHEHLDADDLARGVDVLFRLASRFRGAGDA
jgi:acetylornithine deacetylase